MNLMSDYIIAFVIIAIAAMVLFDFIFLRWLRRRNHKFDLTPYPKTDTPPCWPYGWPGE